MGDTYTDKLQQTKGVVIMWIKSYAKHEGQIDYEIEGEFFWLCAGADSITIHRDDVEANMGTFESLRNWLEGIRVEVEREAK